MIPDIIHTPPKVGPKEKTLLFTHNGINLRLTLSDLLAEEFLVRCELADDDSVFTEDVYELDDEGIGFGPCVGEWRQQNDSAGELPEGWWDSVPPEFWTLTPQGPVEDSDIFFVLQRWDSEGGWEDIGTKTYVLAEAEAEFEKRLSEGPNDALRVAYYTGGTVQKSEGQGLYRSRWTAPEVVTVRAVSFIDRLKATFPSIPDADARDIERSRNHENNDPYLAAQAWVRHNLTDYDDRLRAAADDAFDDEAPDEARDEARQAIRHKVDDVLCKWAAQPAQAPANPQEPHISI